MELACLKNNPLIGAAGDDEGLFILVSKQRPWFPTRILSSMQWLKVEFIQNGRSFTMEVIEREQ